MAQLKNGERTRFFPDFRNPDPIFPEFIDIQDDEDVPITALTDDDELPDDDPRSDEEIERHLPMTTKVIMLITK